MEHGKAFGHDNLTTIISDENINIAIIQEPKLVNGRIKKIQGGTMYYTGKSARACIWVSDILKNNSGCIKLSEFSHRDQGVIKLKIKL